jgi:hypothetical protein
MKWKLFVCGVVLVAAGCAVNNGPYAHLDEFGYTYDFAPPPTSGRTPIEIGQDYAAPIGPTVTGSEITMDTMLPPAYFVNVTAYP